MSGQKIVVLGTGGTIAGTAADAADNIGYKAAQVGVRDLLASIPAFGRAGGGTVEAEQVAQVDSKDMDFDIWRQLACRCQHHLDSPSVQGVVITHGTDTLEETAWFLQEVLHCAKPVVLTSAMRPASALTPDGPQNLMDAVALALAPDVCGVFAVAAGEVHGARLVQKVHPYRVNAFASGDGGPMGWMEEGSVRWAPNIAVAHVSNGRIAMNVIANSIPAPRVEIILSHAGATGNLVDALVRDGVQGLVVACTGNGTIHHALEGALLRAQAAGVKVVRATRCNGGQVLPKPGDLFGDSQGLSPVKARISLMLDLLAGS